MDKLIERQKEELAKQYFATLAATTFIIFLLVATWSFSTVAKKPIFFTGVLTLLASGYKLKSLVEIESKLEDIDRKHRDYIDKMIEKAYGE